MSDSYDGMDYSPPGSSVHGISQARVLKWVAISFSSIFEIAPKKTVTILNYRANL